MCKALNPSARYITQEELSDMIGMAFAEHMDFLRKEILAAEAKAAAVGA